MLLGEFSVAQFVVQYGERRVNRRSVWVGPKSKLQIDDRFLGLSEFGKNLSSRFANLWVLRRQLDGSVDQLFGLLEIWFGTVCGGPSQIVGNGRHLRKLFKSQFQVADALFFFAALRPLNDPTRVPACGRGCRRGLPRSTTCTSRRLLLAVHRRSLR